MGRSFEKRKHKMFARYDKMAKAFTRIGKEIAFAFDEGYSCVTLKILPYSNREKPNLIFFYVDYFTTYIVSELMLVCTAFFFWDNNC